MADFYRMDPGAWDFGTASLSLEEEAAYLRIVNAIHKHKAPVPMQDRVLAGMFRSSTRKARALVEALVKAGKITIEDGLIWNDRARSDLVQRGFVSISRAESGAKGGRTRAENAAKALKDKEPGQAIASTREEKRREERDTNVSLTCAAKVSKAEETPEGFTDFWEKYPHRGGAKKGKAAAVSAWRRAIRAGRSPQEITAAAIRYSADRQVIAGYAKDPATWLNQKGWQDEIEPGAVSGHGTSGQGSGMVAAFAAVAARRIAATGRC